MDQGISQDAREEVIRLEKVSVEYRAPTERVNTFKEYMIRTVQGKIQHQTFLALRDVNLTVYRNEIFGMIGNNGAGKSTMLKVVARVLRPSAGRVCVDGRVAPLLELGAGFHPELSGRENIYLNGALLGFTRAEMDRKFDSIVDFSELGDFIEAPVRTYSSGMTARLGFSVAMDANPDILILDEVLSVGDESFQNKCLHRIQDVREHQATILLVSHSMKMIQSMCDRVVWLDHGRVMMIGDAHSVIEAYRSAQK